MQGTQLNTVTFKELTDLVRRNFVQTQGMVKPVAGRLFITQPIENGQGNTKNFTEIDTQTYARNKAEGSAVKKASAGVGYEKIMRKKRVGTEIDITQEMRDENRYSEVGSLITNLAHFVPQRVELDLTHRLTFCDDTSYTDMDGEVVDVTGGDGKSIVSTAHTLKFSSETWRNRVSSDPAFSKSGLEAAELLATTDILSNFGERRVMSFNAIVTGDNPSVVNDVKQFLNSTADPDSGNANSGVMNVYRGKYQHIVLPHLATTANGAYDSTKKKWWFLGAIEQGTNGWQAYHGVWEQSHMTTDPAKGNNAENPHTDVWTYGTRGGYGIAAVSGRGLIASLAT